MLEVHVERSLRVRVPPRAPSHATRFFCYNTLCLKYKYLYQTKDNENREGWIVAANRAEAYAALRRQGIRPYRVIGDDPWNWRPWAISAGYVVLSVALVVLGVVAMTQARQIRELQMVEVEEMAF